MAITSLDGLIAAPSQRLTYLKTASKTTVAAIPFSVFDLAGNPAAGVAAIGNTTTGVVPTDTVAGYPTIQSFVGGNIGYLVNVQFGSSVACRMTIFDCLFSAGAFAFTAQTNTLSGQPSYASRVLGGTDFTNTEIWVEAATAFTGTLSLNIGYLNQDGVAKTTGVVVTNLGIQGRMFLMPLAAGDTGVQRIDTITPSVATAGTFNVHVMRRLWQGRVRINNDGDVHDFTKTGMPQIFDTSALRFVIATDGTSTGVPEFQLEISNG